MSENGDHEKQKVGDGQPWAGSTEAANIPAHGSSAQQSIFAAELQKALNAIPAHTWYAMPSGAFTFVNERLAEYHGLPEDDPLRFGIYTGAVWDSHIALVHPEDRDETLKIWSRCLETGLAGEVHFRIPNAQGVYRWFITRIEPLRASDGTLLYWVGLNLDMEERKRTEFYLLEAQRLARVGSWALGSAGFEYWSDQLFDIHGLTPGDKAPSMSEYMELVHPDDRDFVADEIRKMQSARGGFDFTKRIVRPDGHVRYVRCVGVPASDGFAGTGIDVTEQEQLTRALRHSEEELRKIIDLTPQLVAVIGPNRERLYANQMALDYVGLTLEEWRETGGSEFHPDDFERILSQGNDALSDGLAFEIEMRIRGREGKYRWYLARYNPVRDDEGRVQRWYIACTDIEDLRRTEERLQLENAALREEINQAAMFEQIIGVSEPLQNVVNQATKVALTDSTVLILGETGTGKELIARAIHKCSKRATSAFIAVNCGAIASTLIATELFGHEKGAFTGATQRRLGRFEAANGGTLFLDEVGDLPPDTQIALLRVLQEHEIERVGSSTPIPVNVRVLAATHHDLEKLVREGRFRADLFYRLNVVPIRMPPLRARADDIPLLAEYFIDRFGKKIGKKFQRADQRVIAGLQAYPWPGNVREFQNVIERAVTLSETDVFIVDEAWLKREPSEVSRPSTALGEALLAREKEAIEAALAQSHGRVSGSDGAAAKLGIPTTTLDSKIKRLGIDKYRFKSNAPTS